MESVHRWDLCRASSERRVRRPTSNLHGTLRAVDQHALFTLPCQQSDIGLSYFIDFKK